MTRRGHGARGPRPATVSSVSVRPPLPLADVLSRLLAVHGEPDPPLTRDPYEQGLLESCAYLVDDERRRTVFERLRREIGLAPADILGARPARLAEVIADGGMHPDRRAEKLRTCAGVAGEVGVAALRRLVESDPKAARKVVRRFPGIAEPGADRILLVSGGHRCLAPDSNVLRVLLRLGHGTEDAQYARSYRSAREAVADQLPASGEDCWRLHALLRRHGQLVCRNKEPACGACPLADGCAFRLKSGPASSRSRPAAKPRAR